MKRPLRFLLVLLSLLTSAAWGQAAPPAADLQVAFSGGGYPLMLKVKDLDVSWRRVTLGLLAPLNVALPQGLAPPAGGSGQPALYYTKGQTVSMGSETFLAA